MNLSNVDSPIQNKCYCLRQQSTTEQDCNLGNLCTGIPPPHPPILPRELVEIGAPVKGSEQVIHAWLDGLGSLLAAADADGIICFLPCVCIYGLNFGIDTNLTGTYIEENPMKRVQL